jgi:hypothetical protein
VIRAASLLVLSLGLAPYQCGHPPDPSHQREETPGEALYALAQEFRAKGDERACRATLEYLVRQYPSSRFAASARTELGDAGDAASR